MLIKLSWKLLGFVRLLSHVDFFINALKNLLEMTILFKIESFMLVGNDLKTHVTLKWWNLRTTPFSENFWSSQSPFSDANEKLSKMTFLGRNGSSQFREYTPGWNHATTCSAASSINHLDSFYFPFRQQRENKLNFSHHSFVHSFMSWPRFHNLHCDCLLHFNQFYRAHNYVILLHSRFILSSSFALLDEANEPFRTNGKNLSRKTLHFHSNFRFFLFRFVSIAKKLHRQKKHREKCEWKKNCNF